MLETLENEQIANRITVRVRCLRLLPRSASQWRRHVSRHGLVCSKFLNICVDSSSSRLNHAKRTALKIIFSFGHMSQDVVKMKKIWRFLQPFKVRHDPLSQTNILLGSGCPLMLRRRWRKRKPNLSSTITPRDYITHSMLYGLLCITWVWYPQLVFE